MVPPKADSIATHYFNTMLIESHGTTRVSSAHHFGGRYEYPHDECGGHGKIGVDCIEQLEHVMSNGLERV